MSLFTDRELITADSLAAIDSSVPRVAAAEDIVLEGVGSVIRQAWTEVGQALLEWMQTFDGNLYPSMVGNVLSTGLYTSNRARWLLNQVITTNSAYLGMPSPFVQFATHYAMTLFWKQAVRRTEKDRYLEKLAQAEGDKKEAKRKLWANGVPVVYLPLSAPGALFDPLAGVWSSANVGPGVLSGTITESTAFDVAITWVDSSSYQSAANRGNAESGPSAIQTVSLDAGQSLKVTLDGLNPPGTIAYQVGVADGLRYARNASGWNVYAAPSGQTLTLQNSSPLALNQDFDTATVTATRATLSPGQFADLNQRLARPLWSA